MFFLVRVLVLILLGLTEIKASPSHDLSKFQILDSQNKIDCDNLSQSSSLIVFIEKTNAFTVGANPIYIDLNKFMSCGWVVRNIYLSEHSPSGYLIIEKKSL